MEKPEKNNKGNSENLINKNVSPNEDETRSWDDTNQLDRENDKEKLAGSGGSGQNPDDIKGNR